MVLTHFFFAGVRTVRTPLIDSGASGSGGGGGGGSCVSAGALTNRLFHTFHHQSNNKHILLLLFIKLTGSTHPCHAGLRLPAAPRSPPSVGFLVSPKLGWDLSSLRSQASLRWRWRSRSARCLRCQWLSGPILCECLGPSKWPIMDILWILWSLPAVIAVEGKLTLSSRRVELQTKRVNGGEYKKIS